MKKKTPLHLRTYIIVSDKVETGIARGINRYLKYHDANEPIDEESLAEHLGHEIMSELCDAVDFGDDV